ncbi:MAG: hypothetical protein ACRD44_14445 [Bryobacteraceae bacterium]
MGRFVAMGLLSMTLVAADPAYRASEQEWRRKRQADLVADEGWTTVAGLFWLKEGRNTFGSAPSNDIVFPALAPPKAGYFEHRAGRTTMRLASQTTDVELKHDTPGPPNMITLGDLSFFLILRNDRHAIRLRDKNSRYRREFAGLHWYPIDERWRVEGRFTPHPSPKPEHFPIEE